MKICFIAPADNYHTIKWCNWFRSRGHEIHVVSIFFLALLGIVHPIFWMTLGVESGIYLLLDIVFSAKLAANCKEFFALIILFPIFHVIYGFGSIFGIMKLFSSEFKDKGYVNRKI